jgi:hypothetical protein
VQEAGVSHAVLRRVLPFLGTRRLAYLVSARFHANNRPLQLHEQIQLAFYDWLSHIDGLETATQDNLVNYCGEEFWREFADALSRSPASNWPSVTFTICDSKYALLEGRQRWYDLFSAELLDELPAPAITYVTCDITALWARTAERLAKLQAEVKQGVQQQSDPSQSGEGEPGGVEKSQ